MPIEELLAFAHECERIILERKDRLSPKMGEVPHAGQNQQRDEMVEMMRHDPATRGVVCLMYCALSTAFGFKTIKRLGQDPTLFDEYLKNPNGSLLNLEQRQIVGVQYYRYIKQDAIIQSYTFLESEIRRLVEDHSCLKPVTKREGFQKDVDDWLASFPADSIKEASEFTKKITEKYFGGDFITINRYVDCLGLSSEQKKFFQQIKGLRDAAHDGFFDKNGNEIVYSMDEFPKSLHKILELLLHIEGVIKQNPTA